ncbi:MAG TPA: SUMF1/EgtB/PvdO family nonheme iron enzyme, partial [Burkholderiales bacterium]|nr:SUMF1/EgtB/PvdO family nonheme iron enzyme [Burkholderiales bacterium]
MRIFLSYASEDRSLVEPVALALRAQRHKVFVDRDSLPPGEEYDIRIRKAIEESQLFIFFVSPESLDAGSYTLTELDIAQKTWAHPAGRVLPVVLRRVGMEELPPYLAAVTLFEPAGNLSATVADEVHRRARARGWRIAKACAAGIAAWALVGAGVAWFVNREPAKGTIGKGDGAPTVLVPAGNFQMGDDEESPRRDVYVDAFNMDRQEVTVARFARFMLATGSLNPPEAWPEADPAGGGDLPVIGVDWNDAEAYCRWAGKRLPTEAEWEKAARGTDGRLYPWGSEAPTAARANFGKPAGSPYKGGLAPAGRHP